MYDPYEGFETVVLPNGLTIYASHLPGRLWQRCGFLVHSGADQDPVGLEGMAHFVEHLVYANTLGGTDSISDFCKELGGSAMLGSTSHLSAEYSFFLPAEGQSLTQAFSMFGDNLFNLSLTNGVQHEQSVVLEEFDLTHPTSLVLQLKLKERQAVYGALPRGRTLSILGWPETIKLMSSSNTQDFYDKHYIPANVSVVTVGGIPITEVLEIIKKSSLAVSKTGRRTALPLPLSEIPALTERFFEGKFSDFGDHTSKSARYFSGALLPRTHAEFADILFRIMLQDKLFKVIREDLGWTYGINSSVTNHVFASGLQIKCNSFNPSHVGEMHHTVGEVIDSVVTDVGLFEKKKRMSIASRQLNDFNSSEVMTGVLNDLEKYQRIRTITEEISIWEAVTFSDVEAVAKSFAQDKRFTILLKP